MSGEEFIIAVVAIVGGVGLAGFIFYNIFKLIRTWMGGSSYDDETFERLARAFMQHKKETERRLQNLEAIVTEDEGKASTRTRSSSPKQIEEPRRTIEIEEDEESKETKSSDGNLRNMLRE